MAGASNSRSVWTPSQRTERAFQPAGRESSRTIARTAPSGLIRPDASEFASSAFGLLGRYRRRSSAFNLFMAKMDNDLPQKADFTWYRSWPPGMSLSTGICKYARMHHVDSKIFPRCGGPSRQHFFIKLLDRSRRDRYDFSIISSFTIFNVVLNWPALAIDFIFLDINSGCSVGLIFKSKFGIRCSGVFEFTLVVVVGSILN